MRHLPFFEDPATREDILDHISGYVFDRAQLAMADEPMRIKRYVNECWNLDLTEDHPRKRSVRR
jgi:hypothetical protein